jgi:hypothetical protein
MDFWQILSIPPHIVALCSALHLQARLIALQMKSSRR